MAPPIARRGSLRIDLPVPDAVRSPVRVVVVLERGGDAVLLEQRDEERQHAQDLMDRIIFLEGLPNLQTLDPLRIGQSVKECLEGDLAAEYVARALYHEAREVCREEGDYVSMGLFEQLLKDEESHIDFLETQLGLIERIGIDNYSLLHAKSADQAE